MKYMPLLCLLISIASSPLVAQTTQPLATQYKYVECDNCDCACFKTNYLTAEEAAEVTEALNDTLIHDWNTDEDDEMDNYDHYLSSYGVMRTRRLKAATALSFFSAIFGQLSNLVVALSSKNKTDQKAAALNLASAIFGIAAELSQKESMQEEDYGTPDSVLVIEATRTLLHDMNSTSLTSRSLHEGKTSYRAEQGPLTLSPNSQEDRFKKDVVTFVKELIAIFEKQIASTEPQFLQPIHAILQDLMEIHFDHHLPSLTPDAAAPAEEKVETAEEQPADSGITIGKLKIINQSGGSVKMSVQPDEKK